MIAEQAEYAADGVEYVIAARHLGGREVARTLRNRRFLCHCFDIFCKVNKKRRNGQQSSAAGLYRLFGLLRLCRTAEIARALSS